MESTISGLQVELMAQAKGLLFVNSHHDGTDLLTIVSSIDISGGSAVYLAFGFSKEHPPGDPLTLPHPIIQSLFTGMNEPFSTKKSNL